MCRSAVRGILAEGVVHCLQEAATTALRKMKLDLHVLDVRGGDRAAETRRLDRR